MSDVAGQPEVQKASPEARIAALFGGPAAEPATPVPTPVAEDTAVEAPQENLAQGVEQADEAAQPEATDDPFEELTHLDKTYEVPASLKKAFEENRAMATRSAQTAKQAEALLQHVNAQAQLMQADAQFNKWAESELTEKARLAGVLDQYKKLDWYAMSPDQYAENRRNRDILAEQLADVEKTLGGKREQYEGWRAQQYQESMLKGVEFLRKAIPNFESETTKLSIANTALSLGFTQAEVQSLADPRLVVALHKAAQWDRLQAQKPGVTNKIAKAAPLSKPGASSPQNSTTAVTDKALRARLKQSGKVEDMAALLLHRMR